MAKQFQIIVADPPWSFSDSLTMSDVKRGAKANYSTMSIEDLKALPVKAISDPSGCLLALWVPSALLSSGLDLMQAWGFQQKQTYVWVKSKQEPFKNLLNKTAKTILSDAPITKTTIRNAFLNTKEACKTHLDDILQFGLGRLFRQTHEICLVGTNNNGVYQQLMNRSQRSVSFASNLKHSSKPETLQDSLEIMFPNKDIKFLELFARRQRPQWVCLGNEAPKTKGEDIRVSLDKMING
jgi:N6-adenosine-specific RNA methylase IME4